MATRQAVLIGTDSQSTSSPKDRGGKGAALADMAALGLPVPPFFTIPTGIARSYLEHGRFPKRFEPWLAEGVLALEKATGKTFADSNDTLIVSVRSGAPRSMPGMMDTILNVGLFQEALTAFSIRMGEACALSSYDRLIESFRTLLGEELPQDPYRQLFRSIEAVIASWNSPRATVYRAEMGIPDWIGTAVTVQSVVFGNAGDDSCTGVVFSTNVATGEDGLYGEFLPNAQGEDLVSGKRTPLPLRDMQSWNPKLYAKLERHVMRLAAHYGDVVDVEFTVERGKLYLLQVRRAARSPLATAVVAVRKQRRGEITRREAVESVPPAARRQLVRPAFMPYDLACAIHARCAGRGLTASIGAGSGYVLYKNDTFRVQQVHASGHNYVLVAEDTSPEDLPLMLRAQAIVTGTGGETCHAAVVARELGIPAVVGIGSEVIRTLRHQFDIISVDGGAGVVVFGDVPKTEPVLNSEVNSLLRWVDRFAPKPRVNFAYDQMTLSANTALYDFYMAEAMANAAGGSPLAAEVSRLREKIHQIIAEQLATYLVIAVAGELRHATRYVDEAERLIARLKLFGQTFSSDRALAQDTSLVHLLSLRVPRLGAYLELAEEVFGLFKGDGYGGPKWAAIAAAPLAWLQGRTSATIFVDHAFDLQHNGGRLFDKRGMYYTATNEQMLRLQLDIKKRTKSVRRLHVELSRHETLSAPFSAEVQELYARGAAAWLW